MPIVVIRNKANKEEEGYFVSMTDMMVGMLFLFIIMLMYFAMKFNEAAIQHQEFAMKFNEAAIQHQETVQNLIGADETRKDILESIGRSLKAQGVAVVIDTDNGILRLPESILFDINKSFPTPAGSQALEKLAFSISQVLPCYAYFPGMERPINCPSSTHSIESIFVEGHTDSSGDAEFNWRLSMDRALHTYQDLIRYQQNLQSVQNRDGHPVISIAGYGKQRPAFPNDTPEHKSQNRRIDLRFIMSPPKAGQLDENKKEFEF